MRSTHDTLTLHVPMICRQAWLRKHVRVIALATGPGCCGCTRLVAIRADQKLWRSLGLTSSSSEAAQPFSFVCPFHSEQALEAAGIIDPVVSAVASSLPSSASAAGNRGFAATRGRTCRAQQLDWSPFTLLQAALNGRGGVSRIR
jgi:hypothetical protein